MAAKRIFEISFRILRLLREYEPLIEVGLKAR